MVLGDELTFEDECLMLAFDDDVVEARNELHHERDLRAIVGQRDVLAQASAQVLGLADVDDLARSVFPKVAAGIVGHLGHLLDKARGMVAPLSTHVLGGGASGKGREGHGAGGRSIAG